MDTVKFETPANNTPWIVIPEPVTEGVQNAMTLPSYRRGYLPVNGTEIVQSGVALHLASIGLLAIVHVPLSMRDNLQLLEIAHDQSQVE